MCEFKTEEHKMTTADVRRIAKSVVWNNAPSAIAEDAAGIVSAVLANDPYSYRSDGLYWNVDPSNEYGDRHQVTDEQFAKLVAETDKQAQRVSKVLDHPTTDVRSDRYSYR